MFDTDADYLESLPESSGCEKKCATGLRCHSILQKKKIVQARGFYFHAGTSYQLHMQLTRLTKIEFINM